jgi:hypothetical protein
MHEILRRVWEILPAVYQPCRSSSRRLNLCSSGITSMCCSTSLQTTERPPTMISIGLCSTLGRVGRIDLWDGGEQE